MDALSGLTLPLGRGNMLSVSLLWNERLSIYEPIMDVGSYAESVLETCRPPTLIDRRTLQDKPSLIIIDMCSTYFGAMMVGMANLYEMRDILNGTVKPKNTIRDTHDDDGDSGIPVLVPV